ncbi:MAG: hypothetical protein DMG00_28925, partial [Acidobacteria bacterium]
MAGGEHVRSGPVKLTYDDLLMLPDDGKRHEIVDGEHYVTPSPFTKHQTVSMNLTKIFVRYLDRHPIGYLLAAPMDVVFSDFDVVEPDLLFVSRERRAVITDKHVMGAPDLVIEIVSARSAESLALHGSLVRLGRASLSGEPHARLKASRYTAASRYAAASRDSVGRAFQASRT